MILKILGSMSGPDGSWSTGDRYECDDVAGARLIAAGRAEPWREGPVEHAAVTPPETAAARPPVARGRAKATRAKPAKPRR